MSDAPRLTYGSAIRAAFQYLLTKHPEVFVLGQGLWSPWYVGSSMTELEVEFGRDRVIDSPVSEQATTGIGLGAALVGKRPVVVHPRMDFMILAMDQIVTQAANWSSMFGSPGAASIVVRGIVNRGGAQGPQHSQALHAWFAHVPGLRVAMPHSVQDARDLLISAVLCDDPVLYIDDRWLYEMEADVCPDPDFDAIYRGPNIVRAGSDVTVVAAGYSVTLALEAARILEQSGAEAEVVDLRTINPLMMDPVIESVIRTGRLVVVDGGWSQCGLAGEVIASVCERVPPTHLKSRPRRITLAATPAPTSSPLEEAYYHKPETICEIIAESCRDEALELD